MCNTKKKNSMAFTSIMNGCAKYYVDSKLIR